MNQHNWANQVVLLPELYILSQVCVKPVVYIASAYPGRIL